MMKKTLIPVLALAAATTFNSQDTYAQITPEQIQNIAAINSLLLGPKPTFSAEEGGKCKYTNKNRTIIAEPGQTITGNNFDRNGTFTGEAFHNAGYKPNEFTINGVPTAPDQLYTEKKNALSCNFTELTYLMHAPVNATVTNNKNGNSFELSGAGNIKDLSDVNLEGIIYSLNLNTNINYENPFCTPGTTYDPMAQQNLECNATRKNINVIVEGTGSEGNATINYDGNQYTLNPGTITQIPFTYGAALTHNPNINVNNHSYIGHEENGRVMTASGATISDSNKTITLSPIPTGTYVITEPGVCAKVTDIFNPSNTVTKCDGQTISLENDLAYMSGSGMPIQVELTGADPKFYDFNEVPLPNGANLWFPGMFDKGYALNNRN